MATINYAIGDCVFVFEVTTNSLSPLDLRTVKVCNQLPEESEISWYILEDIARKVNNGFWEALHKEMSDEEIKAGADYNGISLDRLRNFYTPEDVHNAIDEYRDFATKFNFPFLR